MQAIAMINQSAVAPKPVSPTVDKATYSDGNSDDRFLPVLQQANSDVGDGEELAGAAMVPQNEGSQEAVATEGSEFFRPELVQPELVQPELVQPELVQPELVQPELVQPELVQPELVQPELVQPELVQPELVQPGATLTVSEESVVETAARGGRGTQPKVEVTIPGLDNKEAIPQAIHHTTQEVSVQAVVNRQDGLAVRAEHAESQAVVPTTVSDANTGVIATPQQVAVVAADQGLPELKIPMPKKMLVQDKGIGDTEALELKVASGKAEVITDPRFAALLNKPEIVDSLRQHQGADVMLVSNVDQFATAGKGMNTVDVPELTLNGTDPVLSVPADGSKAEGVLSLQSQVVNGGEVAAEPVTLLAQIDTKTGQAHTAEPVLTLRDGSTLPESRVVQQTIDHLTLHARGDSSSITVKLHPEELGELQLRMVMEGDQLKVHLQAQSQQVQEVLERHFPRLRDALQEQGVTVEDFQVSVDSGERNDQQFSQQREFATALDVDPFSIIDEDDMNAVLPAAAAMGGGRSLSVRV